MWSVIAEERASLLETFESLTAAEWETPSLCPGWTVRQVLGHLIISADPPMGRFTVAVARARGSFDIANARLAIVEAERPMGELIERYWDRASKQFSPPGIGPRGPLSDILLHSLDVRIPLGLASDRPAVRYQPALELLFTRRAQVGFVPKRRPALRWVATDHDWSHGSGAEVMGTMADLALAASGRSARLDALIGPGQPSLVAWLER